MNRIEILKQGNPFLKLDVSLTASKEEIIKKTAQALKRRDVDVRAVAAAQKTLFHSPSRAVAEFLYGYGGWSRTADNGAGDQGSTEHFSLEPLSCFDEPEKNAHRPAPTENR
jgi:hypothetical protein